MPFEPLPARAWAVGSDGERVNAGLFGRIRKSPRIYLTRKQDSEQETVPEVSLKLGGKKPALHSATHREGDLVFREGIQLEPKDQIVRPARLPS